MKISNFFSNIKTQLAKRKNLLLVLSLVFTLIISVYNRVIGALTQSLWNESISIYYFVLVGVRAIILGYVHKSKSRKRDGTVFVLTKVMLFVLNVLLIVPIILMITNKRPVKIDLIFSIAIALYTTIKTTTTIMGLVKTRKERDVLQRELKVINLMDMVVSILTLQNTLIAVNSTGFDQGLYYLTIASSIAGWLVNMYFLVTLRRHKDFALQTQQDATNQAVQVDANSAQAVTGEIDKDTLR